MLPSKYENTVTGVVLMQIVDFKEFPSFTKIYVEVSNFKLNRKKIEINLFHNNNWGIGAKDLLELLNEAHFNNNIINKLIYVKLDVNNKGYQKISTLFFTIEKDQLPHDPRILSHSSYADSLENIFDDSLDIFDF